MAVTPDITYSNSGNQLTENLNYLQPSGFKIVVDHKRFPNFSFFAQSIAHPNLTTNAAELPFRRFTSAPQIPDTYSYGELSMNIILDEDLKAYTDIHNWLRTNVDNNVTSPSEDPNQSSYADLIVTILSSHNNLNKQFKYRNCFPTEIGSINMEANTVSTEPVTCPVSFRYTYFDII